MLYPLSYGGMSLGVVQIGVRRSIEADRCIHFRVQPAQAAPSLAIHALRCRGALRRAPQLLAFAQPGIVEGHATHAAAEQVDDAIGRLGQRHVAAHAPHLLWKAFVTDFARLRSSIPGTV